VVADLRTLEEPSVVETLVENPELLEKLAEEPAALEQLAKDHPGLADDLSEKLSE
jgi:hypothetical protein